MTDQVLDGQNEPDVTITDGDAPPADAPVIPDYLNDIEVDSSIKADPILKDFKNIGDVVKSYVHAKKMIGADKMVVPNDKSTPEDWANTFKKLGLPDELEKYEVNKAEGSKVDDTFFNSFKAKAFEAGILPHQAKALTELFDNTITESNSAAIEAEANRVKEQLEGLKNEWGTSYDANVKAANSALVKLGSPELVETLKNSGMSNDVHVIKFMREVAKTFGEDKIMGSSETTTFTPDEALTEINKIKAEKGGAYWDSKSPAHADVRKKVENLYKAVYTDK